jgi:hypothetical protein
MSKGTKCLLATECISGAIECVLHKEYQISPVIVLDIAVDRAIIKIKEDAYCPVKWNSVQPMVCFTKEEYYGNRKRNKREGLF